MGLEWRNRILEDNVVSSGQFCRIRLGSLDFEGEVGCRRDGTYTATIKFLPEDRNQPPVLVWKRFTTANSLSGATRLVEAELASWREDLNR